MMAGFVPTVTVLEARDVDRALTRIAHEICERDEGPVVLVGLVTRGATLAARLGALIARIEGTEPATGTLDIGLFRDDLGTRAPVPLTATTLPPIDGTTVVLVDDVLYTGRSIRAALDALHEYGRPCAVRLAVLVDRGHRELPIRPDFVGKNIPTRRNEEVRVRLIEHDGEDAVQLGTVQPAPAATNGGR